MFMGLLILLGYIISFVVGEKCNEDINIKSQTDLIRISECTIYEGNIDLESSVPLIDLGLIEHILGDLVIHDNDDILLFKASNLVSVRGRLVFKKLTELEKIDLPALNSADTIILFQCAQLQSINLNTGVSRLNHVTISDTSLRTISGFSMTSLVSLNISKD